MKYAAQTDFNHPPNPQCEIVRRGWMTRLVRQCFLDLLLRILRRVRLMRQQKYSWITVVICCSQWTAPVKPQSFERVFAHTSCSEICHARTLVGGSDFGIPPGQRSVPNLINWSVMFAPKLQRYSWSYQLDCTNWRVPTEVTKWTAPIEDYQLKR